MRMKFEILYRRRAQIKRYDNDIKDMTNDNAGGGGEEPQVNGNQKNYFFQSKKALLVTITFMIRLT